MTKVKKIKAADSPAGTIYDEIEQKLREALTDWKEDLGEKKFKKRIKKAVKVFSKNLKGIRAKKVKPARKNISASI